jgi:hypothetical protein
MSEIHEVENNNDIKISEEKMINNNKIILPKNSNNDETFNRLLEIQLLIKKESGLKTLCKFLLFIFLKLFLII